MYLTFALLYILLIIHLAVATNGENQGGLSRYVAELVC